MNGAWFWGVILVVLVFLTYLPVRHAGFIWDDDTQVTDNPCIVGPLGLKEIWTTSEARFFPMTLTTYWVEHLFWKLKPGAYHLFNVLEHAISALLLWRVLSTLRIQGAWLGAAIWALHPVAVESVAWVAELKNTQSALFYLLAILFFIRGKTAKPKEEERRILLDNALTLLFSFLAMTSKSSTVILPLVLMLCTWWIDRGWHWRNQIKVWPILVMSMIFSVVTMHAVGKEEQIMAYAPQSGLQRLATAGCAIWFYLGKLLWPAPLMTVYPRWEIHADHVLSYIPTLLVIGLLAILWQRRNAWGRPYFFCFVYFIVALLPVLGLVNHNFLQHSFVADHFQYLASMGPLALAGSGLAVLAKNWSPTRIPIQTSLAAGLLLILAASSWQRALAYESSETLWTDELAKNPRSWGGYHNLGFALSERGEPDGAILNFEKCLRIYPDCPEAHAAIADALFQVGRRDEAMEHYRKALEVDPTNFKTENNFGTALARSSQVLLALPHFEKAIELNPGFGEAHDNLGAAYFQTKEGDKAEAEFRYALSLNQNDTRAQAGLARLQRLKAPAEGK